MPTSDFALAAADAVEFWLERNRLERFRKSIAESEQPQAVFNRMAARYFRQRVAWLRQLRENNA